MNDLIANQVPPAILLQHVIALGKTRSGKSSKLRVLVEYLLDSIQPLCIIDPKGDWWGLKYSPDGKKPGYQIVIFGGDHADVPITDHDGAAVAEIVLSSEFPTLIDLGAFSMGGRTRFFNAFAETLFKRAKSMHLVVDECHNFAPQGKVPNPQVGEMLHWANRLASEGCGKGIKLLAASQRPQKVHKDFLTCFETLIACKMIHELDRKSVEAWVKGCADPALGKQVLGELAQMKRPEAWVWCPEEEYGPERITFPLFKTFDSFAPMIEFGIESELAAWEVPNLEAIRARLAPLPAAAAKKKPGDDDRVEKQLESLLDSNRRLEDENRGLVRNVAAERKLNDELADALGAIDQTLKVIRDSVRTIVEQALGLEQALKEAGVTVPDIALARSTVSPEPWPRPRADVARAQIDAARKVAYTDEPADVSYLTKPVQRILDALAWWEDVTGAAVVSREQVAVIAAYSPTSSNFGNLLGRLRTEGLIFYPEGNMVALTPVGRMLATAADTPRTLEGLHNAVLAQLTEPQKRIMAPVLAGMGQISRDNLAKLSDYSASSSNFGNLLGGLRTLGLIEYPRPGWVEPAEFLFMRGRA